MSFVEAVKTVLTKYVCFEGRSRRSEYWWFCLFSSVISIFLSLLASITGLNFFNVLEIIICLAIFLPSLGVEIRRMHDIGKSGWAILIVLVPVVGVILLIVWAAKDSEPGENKYGPNPKE